MIGIMALGMCQRKIRIRITIMTMISSSVSVWLRFSMDRADQFGTVIGGNAARLRPRPRKKKPASSSPEASRV
jgi:hypothetical protein